MADKRAAQDKIMTFDTLFSTNHIQMLKIFISYLDNQMQKQMAIYIKILELQYAISYAKHNPYQICGCFEPEENFDFNLFCQEIMPFLTKEERKQAEQFISLSKTMEMAQEFSKTFEMMKDFMPELSSLSEIFSTGQAESSAGSASQDADSGKNTGDIMGTLLNMLSPEQKQMFEMFGGSQ